jgi:hypothetical protein
MSPLRSKADMRGLVLKSAATNLKPLGNDVPMGKVPSR